MRKALRTQRAHSVGRTAAVAGLAVLWLLLRPTAPALADAGERSVGSHRWLSPVMLYAPATSALALAGVAGLALHLFRRRRADKRDSTGGQAESDQPNQDRRPPDQKDDDWEQRIAMWEQRLGTQQPAEDDPPPPDTTPPRR